MVLADHLPGVPGDAGSSAGSSGSRTAPANFLSSNLLHAWGKVKEVRLGPEADLAGTEAVEDPIIDEPAPKSPTGDSSITAGIFSNAGATGPDKGQAKAGSIEAAQGSAA